MHVQNKEMKRIVPALDEILSPNLWIPSILHASLQYALPLLRAKSSLLTTTTIYSYHSIKEHFNEIEERQKLRYLKKKKKKEYLFNDICVPGTYLSP